MIEPHHTALIMIDMQNGFIKPNSPFYVAGAAKTVSTCARMLSAARKNGLEVVHVRRKYARDGHDVERTRYEAWVTGGRPLSLAADDPASLDCPDPLTPADGDRVVVKPSFSAFFGTPLHNALKKAGISSVVLIGTSTPNCVRATCYDALALGYDVAVCRDATSSSTPEIQQANLGDLERLGIRIIDADEFLEEVETHGKGNL